ncbi:MAG: phosphotransferase [Actinomycetota bacterium]
MTTPSIPADLGDVSPRWLTDVLRSDGTLDADGAVVALHPRRIGEGVGIMGELHVAELTYEGDHGSAPDSVVVKMPSPFEENREQGVNLGMYEAEVRFYRELAPRTPTGLPTVHMSEIVPGTADFVIVMEDLGDLTFVDQATGMSPDQAQAAVEAIADVHAAWWGKVMVDELDWVPMSAGPRIEMVAELLPQVGPIFLERFGDRLGGEAAAHAEWFIANVLPCYRTLADTAETTLIHSDYRVENIMFSETGEAVIIDWQGLARGVGTYDVAYTLSGSMQIEDRREHERDLVAAYHRRLTGHGIESSLDETWSAYCIGQSVGGAATSVFGGATLDLANERGFELIATMAERHFTAAVDLESRALIEG